MLANGAVRQSAVSVPQASWRYAEPVWNLGQRTLSLSSKLCLRDWGSEGQHKFCGWEFSSSLQAAKPLQFAVQSPHWYAQWRSDAHHVTLWLWKPVAVRNYSISLSLLYRYAVVSSDTRVKKATQLLPIKILTVSMTFRSVFSEFSDFIQLKLNFSFILFQFVNFNCKFNAG